jgi:hypothetical protein
MKNFIILNSIISASGPDLDGGEFLGTGPNSTGVDVILSPPPQGDSIGTANGLVFGDFVLASVPEPSSLALAAIATLAGLGAWARRRCG